MTELHIAPRLSILLIFTSKHFESYWIKFMIFMAVTFPAQLQLLMLFDASKPRDLYFPYSSHLSGHQKHGEDSISILVKFQQVVFKQFELKSISGKSIWVGTVQHSLTSSDLANLRKNCGNNTALNRLHALDDWTGTGKSLEVMGQASFTGNVDD